MPVTLTPSDAPAMAALHAASFPVAWSAEDIAHMLETAGTIAYGQWDGDRLQAMLLVRSDGESVDILTIAVHPDLRRNGLARRLLQGAMTRLVAHGVKRLMLEVSVENLPAHAFYQWAGFVEISRRKDYYHLPNGTREDAVVMECVL